MEGWVTLHRKFLQWEWFDKPEMVQLFIYLLLMAGHTERKYRGVVLQRGELVTSMPAIMKDTKLSEQQTRTCIKRLKSTGEITCKSTNKFTIITICNYDRYQSDFFEANGQTNRQTNIQATDKQRTSNGHNNNNNVIIKQCNNINNNISVCNNSAHTREDKERDLIFQIFFFKNFINPAAEVERFYNNYEAQGWVRGNGQKIVDRIAVAKHWEQEEKDKKRFPEQFLNAMQDVCMEIDEQRATEVLRNIDKIDREDGAVRVCCSSRSSAETLTHYMPLLAGYMNSEIRIALKRTN